MPAPVGGPPRERVSSVPFYQFTVPSGGVTMQRRAELSAAVTKVHAEVTGAPAAYVHCAFVEAPSESIFVAGEPVDSGRLVGIIRSGRSAETKHNLLHGLADAWSAVTGEAKDELAIFLLEAPGANIMEAGVVLPEASHDAETRA